MQNAPKISQTQDSHYDLRKNSRNSHRNSRKSSDNSYESNSESQDILQKYDDLCATFMECDCIEASAIDDYEFEIAKSLGIPLFTQDGVIRTKICADIFEADFCMVDIETTGFSPHSDEIIEIGAIKYHNGEILERFNSYIFAPQIPPKITEITGIVSDDLADAPPLNAVLRDFKIFLSDSIFMAHNLRFDFNFINEKLVLCDIPPMKNARICTLELARKTISAEKYGLGYLNKFLGIDSAIRHRALADCEIALKVFETSLLNLPCEVRSVRDLIKFCKGKA